MGTTAFDDCLRILGHLMDHDSEIRDEITFYDGVYTQKFLDPFRRELGQRLLECDTIQKRINLIKSYIHELNRTANIVEDYKSEDFLEESNEKQHIFNRITLTRDTEIRVVFLRIKHYLYTLLFNEIQAFCITYNINFLEICRESGFPINIINIQLTLENEKKKNLSPLKDPKENWFFTIMRT
jgi:hypothetical protein